MQPPWLQLFALGLQSTGIRLKVGNALAAELVERNQYILYRLQQFNRDLRGIERAMALQKHEDAVFKRDVTSHLCHPRFLPLCRCNPSM